MPLIYLAAFLTSREVYSRDPSERKAVMLDEGDTLVKHPSGRLLVNRLGSDSRKKNTAVFFASQDPGDGIAAGQRLQSLIGAQFVFRLRNENAARRACEGLSIGQDWAGAIQAQSTGQCVFSDPLGRTAKIVVDGEWLPRFADLNTTPRPRRATWSPDLPPTPILDERLFRQVLAA